MGVKFYAPGDSWSVAYQFKQRNDMAREALTVEQMPEDPSELQMVQEDLKVELTEPFLFSYSVGKVEKRVLEGVERQVATLRVTQAAVADPTFFSQQRADTHELALEFELDDLLRPVAETFFNAEYPHGKTVPVDKVSSLSGLDSGSSLYPHVVPRLLTQAVEAAAPAMTPELEQVADGKLPGWRGNVYRKYQFDNGDVVYWAAGQVWPFFVDSAQGYGLLVEHTLATAR
jgi:hypothetical protein